MTHSIYKSLFVITVLFFFNLNSYGQIEPPVADDKPKSAIDLSVPKRYEVGGITTSGSSIFDTRLLLFGIGDLIEVPGDDISRSIKRIWSTGLYEEIDISVTKIVGDLIFFNVHIVERSRLVSFGFKGTRKTEETDLRELIKIAQGNIVNDNMKQTCINMIKKFYVDKGYYNCDVSVEEFKDDKISRGVTLVFTVAKDRKVKINKIHFVGSNGGVAHGRLKKAMSNTKEMTRIMPFYKADTVIAYFIKHPEYYKSKDLLEHLEDYFSDRVKIRIAKTSKFIKEEYDKDKISLINKYNDYGYRDAFIEKDSLVFSKGKVDIYLYVNEGNKYYFRNIGFAGNTKYNSDLLYQLLNISKGDVYNQSRLMANLTANESGNDISSLYMNDGYLFFNANPVEVLIENDSIDIEIRIREGRQALYNKISITGNTKTSDNVILREVTTIPGQLFNRADLIRTQQVLLSLGYFNQETMNVIPTPNEADGTVDLTYVVEEALSDQLELSLGYSGQAIGLILSAGVTFNNFSFKKIFKKEAWTPVPGGDGQRLALKASVTQKYYQYYVFSFTEPWVGGKKPNSLSTSLTYQVQANGLVKTDDNYRALKILGASSTYAKKIKWPDDYFQVSHTLLYQRYEVQNYSSLFVFSDGFSNNLSYTFSLGRSSVNAPIYPREGSDILFSVQLTPPYSLFTNKNYSSLNPQEKYKWLEMHKWKFNLTWYTKIVENLVLNVRFKTGFMGHYNKGIGPSPFERFYLGGDGLSTWALDGREVIGMRGYTDASLTPKVNSTTVGGTIFNKFTAEIRYPITLNPSATIYLLAFAEAGKAWIDPRQYSPFNMYKSAGVGVRIFLPMFGLLGFDWGYGFDPIQGDVGANKGHFHISINQSID
ncbi:MAG: POTRA domain-containing protein [Bacteroidales bacterium]|jgi:outer membrane protein insertion porin family|nr:POTRA domain-containing protein [Bacteroidales bacterium]